MLLVCCKNQMKNEGKQIFMESFDFLPEPKNRIRLQTDYILYILTTLLYIYILTEWNNSIFVVFSIAYN